MNKSFLDKKQIIQTIVFNILKDNSSKVLETKGDYLYELPYIMAQALNEEIIHLYRNLSDEFSEEVDNDAFLLDLNEVLLKCINIQSELIEYKQVIESIKHRLSVSSTKLVKDTELKEMLDILLNPKTLPKDFYKEEQQDELYRIIISTYCQNAAIESGLFQENSIIDITELEKIDERLALHAKKTAFDQACASVFRDYNINYDELMYMTTFDNTNLLNGLVSNKLKSNEKAFVVINGNKMDTVFFPKFIEIIDPISGKTYKVSETLQETINIEIPCVIANANVKVKTDISKFIAITELKDY